MSAGRLVLASSSAIRQTLLRHAGVAFTADAADIDEGQLKTELRARKATTEVAALELALRKAQRVSARQADALVIGADQMLDADGTWFDKPPDMAGARRHLEALSGRTHRLVNGLAVVENGHEIHRISATVTLTMRILSPAFIDGYLQSAGPNILRSVGAYELEGLGAQLFEKIEGDYFSVLGLPLLPLLAFLRDRGIISR